MAYLPPKPTDFTSKEWIDYNHCIKRIVVGDTVYVYYSLRGSKYRPSAIKTDSTFDAVVIATSSNGAFLLGLPEQRNTTFWQGASDGYDTYHPDVVTYRWRWHISTIADGRVAKIVRRV